MPPQRKHERPLVRQIQCWRRLKLETTEADRERRIGGSVRYGCCNDIGRRCDQFARKGKNHHVRHSQHRKLGLAEALIGCRRLLQAAIGIDALGAVTVLICVCKCHRRGKRGHYACLTRIHQLSEQHRADQNTAQGNTQSAKPAIHGAATNPRKWMHHCRAHSMGYVESVLLSTSPTGRMDAPKPSSFPTVWTESYC